MRYKSLDLLKFVLAIIIVMHHFQQVTGTKFDSGINFFYGDIYFGYAVEFFFIISGFTMRIDKKCKWGGYLLHKLLRLYPMIFVSTGCSILVALVYKMYTGQWYNNMYPSFKLILVSLTATQTYVKSVLFAFNNPTWYIGVLVLCYLLWMLGDWICGRYKLGLELYYWIFMVLVGSILMKVLKQVGWMSFLPANGLGIRRGITAFFLGCILAYVYANYNHKRIYILSGVVFVFSCALGISNFEYFSRHQKDIFTFLTFPSILYCGLMFENLLKEEIWNFLGKISYEIYIWHAVFLMILMGMVNSLGWSKTFSRGDMLLFAMSMIGFSVFAYEGIETKIKKCLDLKILN